MADVDLRLVFGRLIAAATGVAAALGAHGKASLSTTNLQVTFPYVDTEGTISDLARVWVEQARPGNHKPLTRPGGPKLAKVSLTAVFADPSDNQTPVEANLGILRAMAGSDQPVVAAFGGMLGDLHWTASGRWVIQGCSIDVQQRRAVDNAVTRAKASLDLLEANIPGWVPTPSTFRYVSAIPGAGTGLASSVVVGPTDTLWSIAWRVYGDPARWIDLGDANGILKPADLAPGSTLIIPP